MRESPKEGNGGIVLNAPPSPTVESGSMPAVGAPIDSTADAFPARTSERKAHVRSWLGLLLLIAILLPVKLERASRESSNWVDELYTLQLSFHPYDELIDLTSVNSHPPLYYLLVKYWYRWGKWMGFQPGIFWVRTMNVLFWLGLAAGMWFGGRKLLGHSAGTVAAWAVSANAQVADAISNLRSYSLVVSALAVCFIVLLVLAADLEHDGLGRRKQATLWFLYFLCGSTALWSHPLSGFMLLLFGVAWLGIVVRHGAYRSGFARGGLLAHLAIAIVFLPWAVRLPRQYRFFMSRGGDWLPDPTFWSWVSVFLVYFPMGDFGHIPVPVPWAVDLLRYSTFFLPLLVAVLAAVNGKGGRGNSRALLVAGLGLGIAGGYVTLTWVCHHLGLAKTFFAPRYSVLAVGVWAVGLVALVSWAVMRLAWKPILTWIFLLPWFLCGGIGQILIHLQENQNHVSLFLDSLNKGVLKPGDPLYVMPSEIIPFYRETLRQYQIHPVEALADLNSPRRSVAVLNLSYWEDVDTFQNRVERTAILNGRLSNSAPDIYRKDSYRLYYLKEFDPGRASNAFRRAFKPSCGSIPPSAVAVATPDIQRQFEGWNDIELTTDLEYFRWGRDMFSTIRFDRPVQAGDYVLHVMGYRKPYPRPTVSMTFRFEGEISSWGVEESEGNFEVALPVHLDHDHQKPLLDVGCPAWTPKEYEKSEDPRPLSFLFSRAWLEPAATPSSRGG